MYSILPGELRYLVKDKNPKNVLQASEYADSISETRDPKFSEVKFYRQNWDNSKKPFNKNYKSKMSGKDGQLSTSPKLLGLSPPKQMNPEEKFDRSPQYDQRTYRQCYNCL